MIINVTINNKKYSVRELDYADFVRLEDNGLTIDDLSNGRKFFSLAAAFVCVVADCDRDRAMHLLSQHVKGGGDIKDIYNAFIRAVNASDFFAKLIADHTEKAEV